jgi:uncharacterized LabA/DUF88 family protein
VRDRFVVLVDAGYLLASAGVLVHGVANRRDLRFDGPGLVQAVRGEAAERIRGDLLRVYWYDAARDRVPTVEHRAVASLTGVKVRLGNLNRQGQQKGVDALLRSDLETLASNGAISRAVLLAGDEDMLPAVEAAQSYGVEMHVWSVEPPYGRNQSERLVWEADGCHEIGRELLEAHVSVVVRPPARAPVPAQAEPAPVDSAPPAHPTPALLAGLRRLPQPGPSGPDPDAVANIGEHIAGKWLVTRGRENLADLLPGPGLPAVIDRELLVAAEEELGRSLRPWTDAKRALREGFWERLYREFGIRV